MIATQRPPSAEELQELVELTRRDPGSPVFVDLGEAYLALGRPREAVDVGARGLKANPHSTEGRLMVSRAFVMLHQWKQAQAELLKVVKSDRSHSGGFVLLGEVLMRRGDYERALPVLQHAQNLDPANPHLLEMLRRARSGQPLDPPAPLPTPMSPAAAHPAMPPPAAPHAHTMAARPFEDEPTNIAPPLFGADPAPQASPIQPTQMLHGAESMNPMAAPPPAAQPALRPAAPPPGAPSVRPRVIGAKPKDAAQGALRQSAAVGENYLNNLLTAGLLDVPNVVAPEADFEVIRGKRWGRSARRAFIFLFVLMFFAIGGGGAWYFYAKQQRDTEVAARLAEAEQLMVSGSHDDLQKAIEEIRLALERDDANTRAMAAFARASGLSGLLYGRSVDTVMSAISTAKRDIGPGQDGWSDIVIGGASMTLSLLPRLEEPKDQLGDVRKDLTAYLDENPDDGVARWLQGMAMLAAGERDAAVAAFKRAQGDGQGPVVATIYLADMLLDEGKIEDARKLYDEALGRSDDHPLALVGQALLRTQTSADPAETMGVLKVNLDKDFGPRVDAYRTLALAMSYYVLEDYRQFAENLDKAAALQVTEPRFLARIALGRVYQGEITEAVSQRAQIAWFGDKEPSPKHPLVSLLDAEFYIATGKPEAALREVGKLAGVRAQALRGRALYDMGKPKRALEEFENVLKVAPEDLETKIWSLAATLVSVPRKQRKKVDEDLDKLGNASNTKSVRYAHGNALWRIDSKKKARNEYKSSLSDLSDEYPNPLAYRARTELANLDLDTNKTKAALEQVDKALEQVPNYLPAYGIKARILLSQGQFVEAAKAFSRLRDESETATAEVELGFAEALLSRKGQLPDDAREAVKQAIRQAKEKGISPEELTRVAPMVGDPAFLEELGVAAPK